MKQADGNDKISGRGLKIFRQRLKFDNYLVNVCGNTIDQILFIDLASVAHAVTQAFGGWN